MKNKREACTCRTIFGFNHRAVGADATGCQIHGLTLAEIEKRKFPAIQGLGVDKPRRGAPVLAEIEKRMRIKFTRDELELVNSMAAIASAAQWGEGDYQCWDEKTGAVFDSLRHKVWALINRPPI